MKDFCIQTIKVPDVLRADHGVLHAASLLVTADARRAAEHIVAQAQEQADKLRAAAQLDAQQAVRREQEEVARRATYLLQGLQHAQRDMLARVETLVVALAQETFDRLVLELTPRERTAAMLRRIVQEAPNKLVAPVLALHPDDIGEIGDVSHSGWELKSVPALRPGTCRLEAASGEWRAEFQLAVDALRSGLGVAAEVFAAPLADGETPGVQREEAGVINLENFDGDEAGVAATHQSH
ncbi:HrpE/YscL family type III secretion apparatus protein [Herbaspirillum sp. RV1423]|uniref:HrpE/YscL family type III secretion apparatus protein n=1 Tax=Herbaspirillum sp. RV1423 TaxID=1443993 RepID=UPI0009DF060C|nr:HrpE/YscL family type III secretion apparatus protein [Herbaspirillum sp. RV1423]